MTIDGTGGVQAALDSLPPIIASDVVIDLGGTYTQAVEYDEAIVFNKVIADGGSLLITGGVAQTIPVQGAAVTNNTFSISVANLTTALGGAPNVGDLADAYIMVLFDTNQSVGEVHKLAHAGITKPAADFVLTLAAGNWTVNPNPAAYVVINCCTINCSTATAVTVDGGKGVTFEELLITSSSNIGLVSKNGAAVGAHDCNFSGCASLGVYVTDNSSFSSTTTARPCHFCGNTRGIYAERNSVAKAYGNSAGYNTACHISGNSSNGVKVSSGAYGEFLGPILAGNGDYAIRAEVNAVFKIDQSPMIFLSGGPNPQARQVSIALRSYALIVATGVGGADDFICPAANTYTATSSDVIISEVGAATVY